MNSVRQGVALSILQIIPSVMRFLAAELRQTDTPLTPPQLGVLTLLAENSYNLSELAEQHSVSLPTMSSMVSKLVKAGWVQRQRSQQDRRVVMLDLTPAGDTLMQEIGQQFIGRVTEQLGTLSTENLETLQGGLIVLETVFYPFTFKNGGETTQ
ncbi:MAG: MarR family transcriptional regulator [Chloroflexi bacterium]|nr:MarR family transcriptional regulator [Chloroflexota bacterium]